MELFANKGFKGATTRSIAKAAGVSEAIIFRHFETKENLYDAIITYTVERRIKTWEGDAASLKKAGDLRTILREFAQFFIERNRRDHTFIRLMMYSALEDHKFREKFKEIYRSPHFARIRQTIETGIEEGLYRPVDPRLTTRSFFWALLHYCIARFVVAKPRLNSSTDEEMVDNLVDIFVHGLEHHGSERGFNSPAFENETFQE